MDRRSRRPPQFGKTTARQAVDLLRRNHIGRIAYSFRDRVDIRPVHYTWRRGWLFGRTSEGSKVDTIRHSRWVALEVDEISAPFDWVSVVVRGTFYLLSPEGSVHDRRLYRRAFRAIQDFMPAALTEDDPVPSRHLLFGISIDEVSGRTSSTAG